jgi:hypothetical protein
MTYTVNVPLETGSDLVGFLNHGASARIFGELPPAGYQQAFAAFAFFSGIQRSSHLRRDVRSPIFYLPYTTFPPISPSFILNYIIYFYIDLPQIPYKTLKQHRAVAEK